MEDAKILDGMAESNGIKGSAYNLMCLDGDECKPGNRKTRKVKDDVEILTRVSKKRKSRIPIVSHEKENQLHLKAKNLQALPPNQSSKTKLTHSYSSYGDTTPNTKEKGSKFGILYDIKRLA